MRKKIVYMTDHDDAAQYPTADRARNQEVREELLQVIDTFLSQRPTANIDKYTIATCIMQHYDELQNIMNKEREIIDVIY